MQGKPQFESSTGYCSFLLLQSADKGYVEKFPFAMKSVDNESHLTSLSCLIWIQKNIVLILTSGYVIQKAILERHHDDNFSSKKIDLQNSTISDDVKFWLYYPFQPKQEDSASNFIKLKVQSLFFSNEISNLIRKVSNNVISSNSIGSILALSCCNKRDLQQLVSKCGSRRRLQFAKTAPQSGSTVYAVSSPFGITSPSLYHNTTRKAIISKVISPGVIVIDLDIRDGEQGAAVFNENMEILGIIVGVIKPQTNINDSQGLAICALLSPFDTILYNHIIKPHEVVPGLLNSRQYRRQHVQAASNLVMQLKVDTMTASGVLIHKSGYILTNRHLLPSKSPEKAIIYGYFPFSPIPTRLELIAFTSGDLDVALLQIPQDGIKHLGSEIESILGDFMSRGKFYHGEDVYAIGYSFFKLDGDTASPYITSGTLSKVVSIENREVMLQTNCVIYNGFSGGMIVDERGNFLGLIVFNLSKVSKEVINNINFSYAKPVFDDILRVLNAEYPPDDQEPIIQKLKALSIWDHKHNFVRKLHELQTVEYVPATTSRPKL